LDSELRRIFGLGEGRDTPQHLGSGWSEFGFWEDKDGIKESRERKLWRLKKYEVRSKEIRKKDNEE